jgi:hypothetical protein
LWYFTNQAYPEVLQHGMGSMGASQNGVAAQLNTCQQLQQLDDEVNQLFATGPPSPASAHLFTELEFTRLTNATPHTKKA